MLQVEGDRTVKMRLSHLDKHFLINSHMKHIWGWDEESAQKGEKYLLLYP